MLQVFILFKNHKNALIEILGFFWGFPMASNKFKAFIIVYILTYVALCLLFSLQGISGFMFIYVMFGALFFCVFPYKLGLGEAIQRYFDTKYYKEQEEIDFQKNLRRDVQRKRALSQIDNENLYYQNQLRIEYIARVAQIHLLSNQYLANMYQQAIINNNTQNELTAQRQLFELEEELKKQGLI